jgi:hypothetical protein
MRKNIYRGRRDHRGEAAVIRVIDVAGRGGAEVEGHQQGEAETEVDLALLAYYDEMLRELEYFILRTAKRHDHNTLYRLRTVPAIGKTGEVPDRLATEGSG